MNRIRKEQTRNVDKTCLICGSVDGWQCSGVDLARNCCQVAHCCIMQQLCMCPYVCVCIPPRVWAYVTLFACVRALACFRATACQSVSRSRPSFSLSLVLVRMVVVVACVYVCVYVCACAQQLSRFHFRVLAFPSTYFSFYTAQMNIAKDIRFLFQTSRRIFVWIFSRFIW